MKAELVETENNKARAMELEAQVFEARRSRARQIWREDSLKAEFPTAEERDQRGEIGGGDSTGGLWGRIYGR